jgi:hypothetical protein
MQFTFFFFFFPFLFKLLLLFSVSCVYNLLMSYLLYAGAGNGAGIQVFNAEYDNRHKQLRGSVYDLCSQDNLGYILFLFL